MRFLPIVVLCCPLIAHAAEPPKPAGTAPATRPFVIAKDTTYLTGPVRKDGTIDYVAAINQKLSQGVTKENNAAIPLLEAIGPITGRDAHFAKVRKQMGLPDVAPAKNANPPAALDDRILDQTLSTPWNAQKLPEVARALDAMKPQLDLIVEASRRDHYYLPLVREKEDDALVSVLLPHLNTMRHFCNALKSRAMLCLGDEDIDGFTRDAMAIVRIGRLNTHAPTLIEMLVGQACEAQGLDALKIAASGGWLSEKQANDLLAQLRAAPARRPMYDVFEGGERGFLLEFLQAAAVHGVGTAQKMLEPMGPKQAIVLNTTNATSKDWNAALRKANGWYDRLADAGKKTSFADRMKAADDVMSEIGALKTKYDGWKNVFAPIEDQMIVQVVPSMQRAYMRETRISVNDELTQTALALAAFRTKMGEYPPELKLLVPGYFKAEPQDAFSGKPLVYKTTGTGYELKSAGDSHIGQGAADDLVIRAAN